MNPASVVRVPLYPEPEARPPAEAPEPTHAYLVRIALASGHVIRYREQTLEDAERRKRSCESGIRSGRIARGATVTLIKR